MDISPPPYQGRKHIKKLSEFLAGLTQEKIDRLADARDQAAEALPAIRQRIDALRDAIDEGWLPPRGIEGQIKHLHGALSAYHLSRYLADALATLDEAEADLAIWQRMTDAQRDERLAEREREKTAAHERRKKQAEISKQQNAFYSAFFAMGISPIPMGNDDEPIWATADSPKKIRLAAESDRQLDALERQISNMGNHLYE
jgi:hypothetical protein